MASKEPDDIFITQVLISTLILKNDLPEVHLPLIKVKISNGPEILVPYRYSPLQSDVQIVKDGKFYKFEKGKSCLFASKIPNPPVIEMLLNVITEETIPFKTIATSDFFRIPYDPHSIKTQSLLKGKINLYDGVKNCIGELKLIITIQLIGSHKENPVEVVPDTKTDVVIHPLKQPSIVKPQHFYDENLNKSFYTSGSQESSQSTRNGNSSSNATPIMNHTKGTSTSQKTALPSSSNQGTLTSGSQKKYLNSSNSGKNRSSSHKERTISSRSFDSGTDSRSFSSQKETSSLNSDAESSLSSGKQNFSDSRQSSSSDKGSGKENLLNLKFKNNYMNNQEEDLNYSEEFCSSDSEQQLDFELSSAKSSSRSRKSKSSPEEMPTLGEERRRRMKTKKKIVSNERPKGWLRSAPVYQGNIFSIPRAQPYSTRASFLRLMKNYPDIQCKMQKEIEKKLKEKLKKLDEEYVFEIEKLKKRRKVRAHVPSFKPKPPKVASKGTLIIPQIDKETLVGESILEDDENSSEISEIGSEFLLLSDQDSIEGAISSKSSSSKISSSKKESSSRRSTSWKEVSKSDERSSSEVFHRSSKKTERRVSNSKRLSSFYATDNSDQSMNLKTENGNSIHHSIEPNNLEEKPELHEVIQEVTPRRGKLEHQASSKTVSSFYPETPNLTLKKKPSPRGVDDINSSIGSDISAKIAALIIPREQEIYSVRSTESISSYEPTDLDEELSSLSESIN